MKKLMAVVLLLSGCMSRSAYIQRTNQRLASFAGQDIQVVIDQIGYYTRSFKSPDGKTVYAWEVSRSMVTPQITQNVGSGGAFVSGNQIFSNNSSQNYQMGGIPISSTCNAYFKVDENQIITDWRWSGNGC